MRIDFDGLFARERFARSGFPRMPTVVGGALVATSHPAATRAGVRALEQGGNAIDAALAAAACLTVCEPTDNGVGGDAFSLVWLGGKLHGLNGSGRSPQRMEERVVDEFGPRSCTVPGAVRAWADLAERFGKLGLDRALAPAIELAEHGVAAGARVAHRWQRALEQGRAPWPPPRASERYRLPELARTLRRIAEQGPAGLYEGPVAEAIADATWLDVDDLAAHRSEWVEPLRFAHRGIEVCEIPPNGSGCAALMALGIYDGLERDDPVGRLHAQIEAMKLAFADAHRYVFDGPLPPVLLDPAHLADRRALISADGALDHTPSAVPYSNTTYLCAVDEDRNAISHIQSLYQFFGSGVLAGDTGVVLQNRASGFSADPEHPNCIAPGKRPFHTIIPGMLLEGGELLGPFGIMGGFIQAQAHVQFVSAVVDRGLDPQAALDEPRFRVQDGKLFLEEGLWGRAGELE
ncbi:MAG: gamma-glutamyltranspeptidase / glutathione hydrolase, partial [Gaiellales bacterium]|nr:gamma-glutamyltranspeptidase / glutathione hydrolase [Gaiellales bacterium]